MRENRLDRASMWLSQAAKLDTNSPGVQKLVCELDCAAERCEQAKKSMDKILRKVQCYYYNLALKPLKGQKRFIYSSFAGQYSL